MTPRKTPTTPGQKLVAAIVAEMAEADAQPDAKEATLLETARQLVDRLDALERAIARDGELLTSKTGVMRVHPAVSEHRQLAATLPKVLVGIVIDPSPNARKDPTKQRAANARWDRIARQREAVAEAASAR